jgi:hypothetical protein
VKYWDKAANQDRFMINCLIILEKRDQNEKGRPDIIIRQAVVTSNLALRRADSLRLVLSVLKLKTIVFWKYWVISLAAHSELPEIP